MSACRIVVTVTAGSAISKSMTAMPSQVLMELDQVLAMLHPLEERAARGFLASRNGLEQPVPF